MQRIIWLIIALAVAALVVPIGVVNRSPVTLVLDPFGRVPPAFSADIPLSALLFLTFMLGLLLGGVAVWLTQGKWRRTARLRTREVTQWRGEADRLTRERDGATAGGSRDIKAIASR